MRGRGLPGTFRLFQRLCRHSGRPYRHTGHPYGHSGFRRNPALRCKRSSVVGANDYRPPPTPITSNDPVPMTLPPCPYPLPILTIQLSNRSHPARLARGRACSRHPIPTPHPVHPCILETQDAADRSILGHWMPLDSRVAASFVPWLTRTVVGGETPYCKAG